MILSRKLQILLTLVPFFAISVGLTIFFFQHEIGLYTLYPTAMCGAIPFIVAVSNKCQFLPTRGREQWFRFVVGTIAWIICTVAFIMIGFIFRLNYASKSAASIIQLFSFSICLCIIALFSANNQHFSEVVVRPLFSNQITDDDFEKEDELDDYFGGDFNSELNPVYRNMEREVLQNRRIATSQSIYCLGFAIMLMMVGFMVCFPLNGAYSIYEPNTFSVSCINQATIDAKDNATGSFNFDRSATRCSYPLCTLRTWSSLPALPPQFYLHEYGDIFVNRGQNSTILNNNCEEYTISQTCDTLGYVGIIGTVKIGQNCRCPPSSAYNSECKKVKDAPLGYDVNQIWYLAFFVSIWCGVSTSRNNFMLWKLLRLRLANYFTMDPRICQREAEEQPSEDDATEMTAQE